MKNKIRVAILFGKGLDGCGVTRGAREIQIWGERNGHDIKIYSYAERKFARGSGHDMSYVDFLKDDIPNISKELENYDIVYINSYPSASNSRDSIDAFFWDLIMKIKKPIIFGMMSELTKMNINKIPYLLGYMNACDVIINFGLKTYFSKKCSELLPSKRLGERIRKFEMWFNFVEETEKLRADYDVHQKRPELLYLGRWTTMKHPRRVLDLGPMLRQHGISARLLGIERSIGAISDVFDHPDAYDMTCNTFRGNPEGTPIMGPYVRKEGMRAMAEVLFGCSFYRMPKDPNGYGDRMEYTQIEIIAVGSLPVFDKHWSENNRLRTGETYASIPYSGIYSDADNLPETVDLLKEVAGDIGLQKKIRDTSYEIIRSECDADSILNEMFTAVLDLGRDVNKFSNIEDLLSEISGSTDYASEFLKLRSENKIVAMGLEEVPNGILAIFDGKKRVEVGRVTSNVSQFLEW